MASDDWRHPSNTRSATRDTFREGAFRREELARVSDSHHKERELSSREARLDLGMTRMHQTTSMVENKSSERSTRRAADMAATDLEIQLKQLEKQMEAMKRENFLLKTSRQDQKHALTDDRERISKLQTDLEFYKEVAERNEHGHSGGRAASHDEAVALAKKYEYHLKMMTHDLARKNDDIDKLSLRLQERDQDLAAALEKAAEAAAYADEVEKLHWQVSSKDRQLAESYHNVQRLEHRLAQLTEDLQRAVKEKHTELDRLMHTTVEKEKKLHEMLQEKDEAMRELLREKKERDRQLEAIHEDLRATATTPAEKQDLMERLKRMLQSKSAEVVRLQSLVKDQRKQLNVLQDKVSSETHVRDRQDEDRERERQELLQMQRKLIHEKDAEIKNLCALAQAHKEQIALMQSRAGQEEDVALLDMHRQVLALKKEEIDELQHLTSKQNAQIMLLTQQKSEDNERVAMLEERLQRDSAKLKNGNRIEHTFQSGRSLDHKRHMLLAGQDEAPLETDVNSYEHRHRSLSPKLITESAGMDSERLKDLRRQLQQARMERQRTANQ